jgi:membrane associated rhomboid family serine protease
MMARKSVQLAANARRTCPCFGVLCFLCAFIASLFGTKSASADTPLPALKATPIAAPAAVLGMMNPYVVAAAAKKPRILGFTFSKDLRDLAKRVEHLAVHGVDLNQRKLQHTEKLNLRVQSRLGGGVLQLCYRR